MTKEEKELLAAKEAEEKSAAEAAASEKGTIIVKWSTNVRYNGESYSAGQKTEINADDYEELLSSNVIVTDEE